MGVAQLKKLLKKDSPIYQCCKSFYNYTTMVKTARQLMKERRIDRGDGPIRVAFLCQYIPAWAKVEPLYQQMKQDPRFEPYLLCVPDCFKASQMIDPTCTDNPVYDYMHQHGYPEAINTLIGQEEFFDIKALNLSYVFYMRPFDEKLPVCYTSAAVCTHSKICFIMYGMITIKEMIGLEFQNHFIRNVYCFFAETASLVEEFKSRLPYLCGKDLCHAACLGMPMIETINARKNDPCPAWNFSHNQFRVIWTPRWTTDLQKGGSNFFNYYQVLLDYARAHTDIDFLFRPHPLTFSNFLETGELTQEQLDSYISACDALPNTSLDDEKEYTATFWNSDVLITDFSSVIPEYLFTGKPVIYCSSNMILTPLEHLQRVFDVCYVVRNKEEMFAALDMLRQGKDPNADCRRRVVEELFGKIDDKPSLKILDYLAEQSKQHK